jgi:hypothetical protein
MIAIVAEIENRGNFMGGVSGSTVKRRYTSPDTNNGLILWSGQFQCFASITAQETVALRPSHRR